MMHDSYAAPAEQVNLMRRREGRAVSDYYGGGISEKQRHHALERNVDRLSATSLASGASSSHKSSKSYIRPYFRSRRVTKEVIDKPWLKQPKSKWPVVIPCFGIICGFAMIGLQAYFGWKSVTAHKYCLVMEDNFAGNTLNTSNWNQEVQLGGFGNGEFEMTTSGKENVYVKNGKLTIRATLQNESLLNASYALLNLTADGTCTSNIFNNCWAVTNPDKHTLIKPVKSGRINTKGLASIRYGRVEVVAMMPVGDWLWPAIWMLPVKDHYGAWPASGEIDIAESRGNNYTYKDGGNNYVRSTLHWGPTKDTDAYWRTSTQRRSLHTTFASEYHVFGLEWSKKYIYTYIDSRLRQVLYTPFSGSSWDRGKFSQLGDEDAPVTNPWAATNRANAPFDGPFYLIINLAVGGTNGFFTDYDSHKPWKNNAANASTYFWAAKDQWYPSWKEGRARMKIDSVKMWQECV